MIPATFKKILGPSNPAPPQKTTVKEKGNDDNNSNRRGYTY